MTDLENKEGGFVPVHKGYQPTRQISEPERSPAEGGYQPTRSEGDNPTKTPPSKD